MHASCVEKLTIHTPQECLSNGYLAAAVIAGIMRTALVTQYMRHLCVTCVMNKICVKCSMLRNTTFIALIG